LQSGSADTGFSRQLGRAQRGLAVKPDVLNHNTETVPRLYRQVRKGAVLRTVLGTIETCETDASGLPTKTGMMLGLGEEKSEVLSTMHELAEQARTF